MSMSDRVILEPGQRAPEFELQDQDEHQRKLSDYRGNGIILFFYPAAMTPGCTKQACDFRDSLAPFEAAGYTVIGISPDAPKKQRQFGEKEALSYPLLSDPERMALTAYGAYGDKKLYGRVTKGVIRSTFVIDSGGIIEHALYNVKATGHVERVRKLLGV